jgi:threonine dehydratase|tara:strand:- start:2491 stop:3738 length:1248 start_codon:yes stop_codon:yes gene_type:complete
MSLKIDIDQIDKAAENLKGVALKTPLQKNLALSDKYGAEIYLKREDLQIVRSYKIRGAYNKLSSLDKAVLDRGVICASAGNHAQGFAYSCNLLGIKGKVYMPSTTPKQKVDKVKFFGKDKIDIALIGDTYDDSCKSALKACEEEKLTFIHPFDDLKVIEGQGTVGKEILEDLSDIDFLLLPVGGGGIASGTGSYFKAKSPSTKLIAIEPSGAASLKKSIDNGCVVELEQIDKFVDGAAVQRVGDKTFEIIKNVIDEVILVPEGKVCSTILQLYNEEAIVVEPAGALTVAALDFVKDRIKGKKVVCVVSGSNNDIDRMQEIKERSLIYEGLKHFFIVRFPQRPGALKEFVSEVLGPNDDITRFEYVKKNAREAGPALVGIELTYKEDFTGLIDRMAEYGINYTVINEDPDLFQYFI